MDTSVVLLKFGSCFLQISSLFFSQLLPLLFKGRADTSFNFLQSRHAHNLLLLRHGSETGNFTFLLNFLSFAVRGNRIRGGLTLMHKNLNFVRHVLFLVFDEGFDN